MPIAELYRQLASAFRKEALDAGVRKESELERKFVVPIAERLAEHHQDVLLFVHPAGRKRKCAPACPVQAPAGPGRVLGCPLCWRTAREWASVAAFGARHGFDLVARDSTGVTLAVEIKFVRVTGRKMPNEQMQRFFGQCALAAATHERVIGLFVYAGELRSDYSRDSERVRTWFSLMRPDLPAGGGVDLIFRPFV